MQPGLGLVNISTVGAGGFGKVFSASVPSMQENRAVKEVDRNGK